MNLNKSCTEALSFISSKVIQGVVQISHDHDWTESGLSLFGWIIMYSSFIVISGLYICIPSKKY